MTPVYRPIKVTCTKFKMDCLINLMGYSCQKIRCPSCLVPRFFNPTILFTSNCKHHNKYIEIMKKLNKNSLHNHK